MSVGWSVTTAETKRKRFSSYQQNTKNSPRVDRNSQVFVTGMGLIIFGMRGWLPSFRDRLEFVSLLTSVCTPFLFTILFWTVQRGKENRRSPCFCYLIPDLNLFCFCLKLPAPTSKRNKFMFSHSYHHWLVFVTFPWCSNFFAGMKTTE